MVVYFGEVSSAYRPVFNCDSSLTCCIAILTKVKTRLGARPGTRMLLSSSLL